MFKLPTRPANDDKPLVHRKFFWTWFLTNAVFGLVDIENMEPDMETNFKMSVLVFGRGLFFRDTKYNDVRCLYFKNGGDVPVYQGQIIRFLVTNPVLGSYDFAPETMGKTCYPVYLTMLDRCQCACGFSDMINTIADDLAQNDVSANMVQYLKRLPVVFKAKTDPDKEALIALLQAISDGVPEIVVQSPLASMVERMDGDANNVAALSEFTEYQQYKLGQFYSMLGVQSVWNLKRERVAASENGVSEETARYNIADIIDNLNAQLDKVNEIFGTDYHARLNVERAAEIAAEPEPEPEPDETEKEGGDDEPNKED